MGRRYPLYDPEAEEKILEMAAELGNLGTTASVPKIPLTEPSPEEMANEEEDPDADTPAPNSVQYAMSRSAGKAPAAVDRTAASVAEAQKGTPLQIDMHWVDELQRNVQGRMFDAQPLATRDLSHAADQFIDPVNQKGDRTDLLGFDDEEGFSRERQIARARAAYGESTPPASRWEDEFLQHHTRISDRDVNRAFLLQALGGGQEKGLAMRESLLRQQAGTERGLAEARAADRASTRIDRGLAEAIAATGNVSPEEAVNLTYGHPLVKAFSSGMYSQGGRAEGQALGLNKEKLGIISKMIMSDNADERQRAVAELNALTQVGVAGINAQGRTGQPIASPADDAAELRLRGSVLAKALGGRISVEQGMAAVQGNLDGIPDELRKQIAQKLPSIMAALDDPKMRGRVLTSSTTQDVTAPDKMQYAIQQSLEIARNKPAERMKFKNDWDTAKSQFTAAWTAWNSLSHKDQELFSQVAGSGWSKDARAAYLEMFGTEPSKDVLDKYSAVQGAINALVKDRSGSAVTGSEWERIASELGIEADNWGPFNSSGAIGNWLKRSGDLLIQHRKNFSSEYAGWEAGYAR